MDIELIKQMNDKVRVKSDAERALEEAGIEFDLGPEEPPMDDYDNGGDEELERIADHWREEGAEMEDDDLRDAIGDDLEQLEYSPEEMPDAIDEVMSILGRGEEEMNGDEMGDVEDEMMGDEEAF